jgi:radical SAM superfamily enzyme YgiQ (UPF0313 family)
MLLKEKKDIKLLFVNPCLRPGGFTKVLPVGLASVMTYFHENDYDFTLLDIDINEYDDAYVENYIKNNHFDIILVGTIVTHYKWIKWFVNTAKRNQPNACVITGNSVAGSIPELFLSKTKGDIVVLGEGEISAYEAVEAIRLGKKLEEVEGIAFRNSSGKYTETSPRKAAQINDLPMINWDFFNVEKYLEQPEVIPDKSEADSNEPNRSMPVITARGCAFKCTFCHYMFWDDPYRNKAPTKILDEIEFMIKKYNATYIHFWDDLSFASAKQAEKLCNEILERGLKFKWIATVRVDLFSRSKLEGDDAIRVAKKMRQAGCYSVGFALESGSPEILKMMNKNIEADAFYETVRFFKEADITCHTSVVFGYPIETEETILQTFDQCYKAEVYPSIGFLLPLPSTGMYDYAKLHGFITDEDKFLESITERQDININMTKMSNEEIMNAIKKGAKKLNDMLDLGLDENTYVKTKNYQNGKIKKKKLPPIDVNNMKRIENDVSFNYARTEFKMDRSKAHLKKNNAKN